jgi:hypothetical protein
VESIIHLKSFVVDIERGPKGGHVRLIINGQKTRTVLDKDGRDPSGRNITQIMDDAITASDIKQVPATGHPSRFFDPPTVPGRRFVRAGDRRGKARKEKRG